MEYEPGWTNGIVTLRDPVEAGWYLNVQGIGSKAVLACDESGEAVPTHPDIPGLDNKVLEKVPEYGVDDPRNKHPWPDLRFR